MRKRTLVFLVLGTLVAAIVGGVGGVVLIALANPGVKGPHVSDDAMMAALLGGAFAGGALVIGIYRARSARKRPAWLEEERE